MKTPETKVLKRLMPERMLNMAATPKGLLKNSYLRGRIIVLQSYALL